MQIKLLQSKQMLLLPRLVWLVGVELMLGLAGELPKLRLVQTEYWQQEARQHPVQQCPVFWQHFLLQLMVVLLAPELLHDLVIVLSLCVGFYKKEITDSCQSHLTITTMYVQTSYSTIDWNITILEFCLLQFVGVLLLLLENLESIYIPAASMKVPRAFLLCQLFSSS